MQANRCDIEAGTETAATFDDELRMLQPALRDRFGLQCRREIRQLTTLSLVAAKGGIRLTPAANPDARERVRIGSTEIAGTGIPLGHFVSILQAQLGYAITNRTGLSGSFDISLHYVRDGAEGPSLSAALEEQLGLKLEARKGPAEVLVIDRAEKPSAN